MSRMDEKALALTQQHGGEKAAKPRVKKKATKPQKGARKKAAKPAPTDPSFYKPGETWETESGNFGGKNKKNQVRYFGTKERADKFAKS